VPVIKLLQNVLYYTRGRTTTEQEEIIYHFYCAASITANKDLYT